MYVQDLRKEFFDLLRHERVVVFANFDIDSLCSVKILQYLFQCDQVSYTLIPVRGRMDLINSFRSTVRSLLAYN